MAEADTQVGVETADRFVIALNQAGLKDVNYHRLGTVDHCPYSLIRVHWLVPAVNEFLFALPPTSAVIAALCYKLSHLRNQSDNTDEGMEIIQ